MLKSRAAQREAGKRHTVDEATKAEMRRLLSALPPPSTSRFSSLILKMGAGYAAMALFTLAALAFSAYNLSALHNTMRDIANMDLPAISALINMRSSLLAQESFAGKYAILKDATFIDLFRQRKKEVVANLAVLQLTDPSADVAALKRQYADYQRLSEELFAGKSGSRRELQSSASRILGSLDALYLTRQRKIQEILKVADQSRRATLKWTIGLSCAGFLLAVLIAPLVIYRIFSALNKLQKATHRMALGDLNYQPEIPEVHEITDLADDFNQIAAKIKKMEQTNLDALPLTPLPGNVAIERVLEERIKSALPFAFCHLQVEGLKRFTARYGYAKSAELLRATGALIYSAVLEHGAGNGFAGHVGGDEFVMVLATGDVEPACEAVVARFDAQADRVTGAADPPTISISVLNCSVEAYASPVEIARAVVALRESVVTTGETTGGYPLSTAEAGVP